MLFAQTKGVGANSQGTAVSVPFVGCASFGQTTILEAPEGKSRSLPISSRDAQALAYYRSADGIGVLAPRGWYCQGVSGSSGYALFLSPKPIRYGKSGWEGLEGPVIEVNHLTSEASGRYEVAEIIARVFPGYRAFATSVMEGIDLPLPVGPYPKDTLIHRGKTIVEYNTPAQTEGLGNFHSWIGKNDLSIRGAAIIIGDPRNVEEEIDLVLLSVRAPPSLAELVPVIVGQLVRETVGARRK
jgi:hypothetical protein